VRVPALGPESMLTTARRHWYMLLAGGAGLPVKTRLAAELPQEPCPASSTVPASVVTAPPVPDWKGSGISVLCFSGQRIAAPSTTTNPMRASSTTTTFAAVGPSGAGVSEWPWPWPWPVGRAGVPSGAV
jgi:hypothetical protein